MWPWFNSAVYLRQLHMCVDHVLAVHLVVLVNYWQPAASTAVKVWCLWSPSQQIDIDHVAAAVLCYTGHSLAVCGFNSRERVVFLTTLMSFGPPFVHPTTEQGWAAFDKAFKDSKDRVQVSLVFLLGGERERGWQHLVLSVRVGQPLTRHAETEGQGAGELYFGRWGAASCGICQMLGRQPLTRCSKTASTGRK